MPRQQYDAELRTRVKRVKAETRDAFNNTLAERQAIREDVERESGQRAVACRPDDRAFIRIAVVLALSQQPDQRSGCRVEVEERRAEAPRQSPPDRRLARSRRACQDDERDHTSSAALLWWERSAASNTS